MSNIIELKNGSYLYLSDYNRLINANLLDTFLENSADQKISSQSLPISKKKLQKKVKDLGLLTLEVTEACNLRCKYCVFNDNYENYRPLTTKQMDWDTARRGIDYAHSLVKDRDKKTFNLSFYGGEPLTNISLIRKSVEYSRQKFDGWSLLYNLTTNLTVLDESILNFLSENNIRLTVSLDGDQSNHDAKRVFKNGKGTHSTIMENLEKIRSKKPEYYEKSISFITVHSYDLPFENLCNFYENNEYVQGKSLRFSNVNPYDTDYYERYPWDTHKKKESLTQFKENLFEKIKNKEPLSPLESHFDAKISSSLNFLKFRAFSKFGQTCLFDSRLYLDTKGRFHVCEKLNHTLSIGNLESGLDYEKMVNMLKNFAQLLEERCSECDIRFICSRCFAPFTWDGNFRIPEGFCERTRKIAIENMEQYITLKEEGVK